MYLLICDVSSESLVVTCAASYRVDARIHHPTLCVQVFERGVAAIPLSVDLWLHYIAHNASLQEAETKSPESTRKYVRFLPCL